MKDLSDIQKSYIERIKMLRTARGMTQEELAKAIYVSKDLISKIEQGLTKITVENLVAIANYFNVNIDWICGRSEALNDPNATLNTLLKFINVKNDTITSGMTKYNLSTLTVHSSLLNYFKDINIESQSLNNIPKDIKEQLLQHSKEKFLENIKETEFKKYESRVYALIDIFETPEEVLKLINNNFVI